MLSDNVKTLKEELCQVQSDMVKDLNNAFIRKHEADVLEKFKEVVRDEELFLK